MGRGVHDGFRMFMVPGLCNSVVASRTTRVRNNIKATNDTGVNSGCTVFRPVRNATPHLVRLNENSCTGPASVFGTARVVLQRVNFGSGTSGLLGTLRVYARARGTMVVSSDRRDTAYGRFNRCMVSAVRGVWAGNPHFGQKL